MYTITENDIITGQSKKYVLRLRDLPAEEKPREKLYKYGPEVLKMAELLAIIFNTGSKKEDVLGMTERIFHDYGSVALVHQKNPKKLAEELDIPGIKACQMVACFEIGRRLFSQEVKGLPIIKDAGDAFNYLTDLRKLKKETLRGLYLNSRNQIIHDEVVSIGSLTSNIIHPREVLKPAIEYSAVAIILAHNHPSGDPTPSKDDIEVTNQICKAAKLLGISIIDHVIVTENKFASIPAKYNIAD